MAHYITKLFFNLIQNLVASGDEINKIILGCSYLPNNTSSSTYRDQQYPTGYYHFFDPKLTSRLNFVPKIVIMTCPKFSYLFSLSMGDQCFNEKNLGFPVDTGHNLNVHKTFRRHPGRLLNVLCTFNLHPVSTGLRAFLVTNSC